MEILLTILAVLGCIAMMGVAMVVLPRVGRRQTAEAPESGGWSAGCAAGA
jgi:hypothetical protein